MKLSDEQIDSIAQDVDMGMDVYLHKQTGKTVAIPDESNMAYAEPEFWEDEIREIEEHGDDYILIQGMSSREGYRVMEDFVSGIEDESIHMVLDVVLSNAKPFGNFKNTLHRFPEVREAWFSFKQERMKQWIIDQIEADNLTI